MAPKTRATISQELRDLRAYGRYWKSVWGVAAGMAALLPLAGTAWPQLVPPWPVGAIAWSLLISVITALMLFLLFKGSSADRLRAWGRRVFAVFWALLPAYVCLSAFLVAQVSDEGAPGGDAPVELHITGFGLTKEAETRVATHKCKSDTAQDLLNCFGRESDDRIWKHRWLAETVLFLTFGGLCWSLVGCSSLFVVAYFADDAAAQRSQTDARPGGAP